MNHPLISIIIPTHNRAHIIGETLDSVHGQTYTNWECIVVDDASTDNTDELMQRYTEKDNRFKYYKRPLDRPKGANACRNYGFELSRGKLINWFDSDDIMLPQKLDEKIKAFHPDNIHMVISKTLIFKHPDISSAYENDGQNYKFDQFCVCQYHFVNQELTWLTPDALIHRDLIGDVRWNEHLSRGQEYNFFSKLLSVPVAINYINKYLTLRRLHGNSIHASFSENKVQNQAVDLRIATFQEINNISSFKTKKFLIYKIIKGMARYPQFRGLNEECFVFRKLIELTNLKIIMTFLFARIFKIITGKNERFIKGL